MSRKAYKIFWLDSVSREQAVEEFIDGDSIKVDGNYFNDDYLEVERERLILAPNDQEAMEIAKNDEDLPEIFSLIREETKIILTEEDLFECKFCGTKRVGDFPISEETGEKYCPDCNNTF